MTMTNKQIKANDVNGLSDSVRQVASGSGGSKASKVVNTRKPCINIGTWNVRTMQKDGKLENLQEEMKKNNINILGISETHWKGDGDFTNDGFRIIHAGGKKKARGVAVILDKKMANSVSRIEQKSDRILLVKIDAQPQNIIVIQVYMPTTQHNDNEIEDMYEEIEELMDAQQGNDYLVIMGDWNTVVGEGRQKRKLVITD